MTNTATLDLPLIAPEQALKHVTHNEAIQTLDAIVHLSVEELGAVVAPVSPTVGQSFDVSTPEEGDWSDHGGEIATWTDAGWRFVMPAEGWHLWDKDTAKNYIYFEGAWQPLLTIVGNTDNLARLGVNTSADTMNRLAINSNAALFTATSAGDGGSGDIRLALNKETETDTASLVMQSGYSGRAEIGLNGGDDFSFKVSPDGSSFHTAITLDKTDGFVTFEKLFGSTPSFPTVVSGNLSVETSYVIPAPETATTDVIDTITGGFDGAVLIVTGTSGNSLTFSDETGNLKLGAARVLADFDDSLMLVKRGADWIELAYANNA